MIAGQKLVTPIKSVYGEVATGEIDNRNSLFLISRTPIEGTLRVYLNGVRLMNGNDYVSQGNKIWFCTAPERGDSVQVDYDYVYEVPKVIGEGRAIAGNILTDGLALVAAERSKQKLKYTLEHDSNFVLPRLAMAALYAITRDDKYKQKGFEHFESKIHELSATENYIKAAALLIAQIDVYLARKRQYKAGVEQELREDEKK